MTLLVRHRPPTEHGLPIEIYVFTDDIRWAEYESIQADIFDHILAVIPEFELRVFQSPSGGDLKELSFLQKSARLNTLF
jgi:miniconductance mechanosensitive channel